MNDNQIKKILKQCDGKKIYFKKNTKELALYFNKLLKKFYFNPVYKFEVFKEDNKEKTNHLLFDFKNPSGIKVYINNEDVQVSLIRHRKNPITMTILHEHFKVFLKFLFIHGLIKNKGDKNKGTALQPLDINFLYLLFKRLTRAGNLLNGWPK